MHYRFLLSVFAIASLTMAACSAPETSTTPNRDGGTSAETVSPAETTDSSAQEPATATPSTAATETPSTADQQSTPVALAARDCDGDGLMDRPYDLDGDGAEDGCDINHGAAEVDEYHGESDPDAGIDEYHGEVDPDAGVDEYHGDVNPDAGVDESHGEVDPDAGLDQYHGEVDPDAGVDEYHGEPDLAVEEGALQSSTAVQIGPAMDCDLDGEADDARMDYDGDGIPEECVIY